MEFTGMRNLFRVMKSSDDGLLDLDTVKSLGRQLAEALAYCHEQGVAHCDLKPENVVVSKPSRDGVDVHLVDFGAAVSQGMTEGALLKGIRGTMPFIAPEVLNLGEYEPTATDMWSMGVLLLELLHGLGIMNHIMRWGRDQEAGRKSAQQLVQFFRKPEKLLEEMEKLEAQLVVENEDIMTALYGLLNVSPEDRWTAVRLARSEWLHEKYDTLVSRAMEREPARQGEEVAQSE
jgi:serine/threonine protein kinase